MGWFAEFSHSSIGRKVRVAVTGLLLCAYLAIHLFGNLFVFGGREAFNRYAEVMEANPLLPLIELALLAVFLVHIAGAIVVTLQNRRARPVPYQAWRSARADALSPRLMIVSGVVLLAFLIGHVKAFRLTPHDGDLYGLELANLRPRPVALFYLTALAFLFPHLKHGFQSTFQSLGLNHPKVTPLVKASGTAFAAAIVAGFAGIVAYVHLFAGGAG